MSLWGALAFGFHLASRMAYVVWVGRALHQQDQYQRFTRDGGIEAGFQRFRRTASTITSDGTKRRVPEASVRITRKSAET